MLVLTLKFVIAFQACWPLLGFSGLLFFAAMPACGRCGVGTRRGRGSGWCSDSTCREAERKEKEEQQQAAKRQRQLAREDQGVGRRGPRPSEAALVEQEAKRLRQEERAEKGAGERGPCPGEGAAGPGRPMDTEEARAEKLEILRGPPFFRDDNFEAVKESYEKFLRAWARFGLAKACEECSTLTPGKYCCLSRTMQKQACKNCRENKTSYKLPPLPPIPPTLAALSYLERRLLAMAKVDQTLIDKLPAGGPSAQWGRMYVVPHDEPSLCNVLEGQSFTKMAPSTWRACRGCWLLQRGCSTCKLPCKPCLANLEGPAPSLWRQRRCGRCLGDHGAHPGSTSCRATR